MTAAPAVGALEFVLVPLDVLVLALVAEAAGAADDDDFDELLPQAAARIAAAAISAESDLRTGWF